VTLRLVGSVFVLDSSYAEKDTPKAAGFFWHDPTKRTCYRPCEPCAHDLVKVWWTSNQAIAVQMIGCADDAARVALGGAVKTVEASRASDADVDIPRPEGLNYLGYQRAGVAFALDRRFTLFGDEMGLGKTIEALGVVNSLPEAKSVLVLCPASLRINWYREARKWLVQPFNFAVIDRTMRAPDWASFVIVNYDKLLAEPVLDSLLAREWDVIVADEMHKLKNAKAKRTRAVYGAPCGECDGKGTTRAVNEETGKIQRLPCEPCNQTGKAKPGVIERAAIGLFLTGTPILNRPIELFPFLHATYPTEFPNRWAYRKKFCAGFEEGASNLEQLQARLRGLCMVRRLKADVLKDLPPKTRSVMVLAKDGFEDVLEAERKALANVSDAQAALAAIQEAKESEAEDSNAYKEAVAQLTSIRIPFEEISLVRHATARAKVPNVLEHLADLLESVDKVVCFAHHRDVLAAIAEPYGDTAVLVDGGTPMDERQHLIDRFQKDPKCRLFVGSITAAGVGITLTAASHVVMAELDWVPANVTQAEDRLHRIGQLDNVTVHHLVIDESIDAKMAKTIVEKQEIADKALDRPIGPKEQSGRDGGEGGGVTQQGDDTVPQSPERVLNSTTDPSAAPVSSGNGAQVAPEVSRPYYDNVDTFDKPHREEAHLAMKMLAGLCDGARQLDGAGFSRYDTEFGHKLANAPGLSHKQTKWAVRLATKYRRQLPDEVLRRLGIEPEPKPRPRVRAEAVA
jgi:SWI/SNF-related matrix-associated actin-dependent regulator 1 of chromatin subfamily A